MHATEIPMSPDYALVPHSLEIVHYSRSFQILRMRSTISRLHKFLVWMEHNYTWLHNYTDDVTSVIAGACSELSA